VYNVFDPDNTDANLPQLFDGADEFHGFGIGEASTDFVEQKNARIGRKRAGKLEALAVQEA
jgi:hypothetical protein